MMVGEIGPSDFTKHVLAYNENNNNAYPRKLS